MLTKSGVKLLDFGAGDRLGPYEALEKRGWSGQVELYSLRLPSYQ